MTFSHKEIQADLDLQEVNYTYQVYFYFFLTLFLTYPKPKVLIKGATVVGCLRDSKHHL